MKRIWDISPLLSADGPTFPGDEPFSLRWTSTFSDGSGVNLCSICLSPHVGAHADAPLHCAPNAPSIADVALEPFMGPCRVIHAIDCGPLVRPDHLFHMTTPLPDRLLIRCCRAAAKAWNPGHSAISPATILWLHQQGVRLIGIDTPSIDPADSAELPSHRKMFDLGMCVLENLVLDEVPENDYELIALPLKLEGACASPVRAVLRKL